MSTIVSGVIQISIVTVTDRSGSSFKKTTTSDTRPFLVNQLILRKPTTHPL